MTVVQFLCLNHQSIIHTTDPDEGALKRDWCIDALHLFFRYTDGMTNPLDIHLIHPVPDIDTIRQSIVEVNRSMLQPIKSALIDEFIQVLSSLREMLLFPEWAIPLPSQGPRHLHLDDIDIKPSHRDVDGILDQITVETGTDEESINLADRIQLAVKRTQACVDASVVSRDKEEHLLSALSSLISSSNINQRWFAFLALNFFVSGGISETTNLVNIARDLLVDDLLLFRISGREILRTLALYNPKLALPVLKDLLDDRDVNVRLSSMSVLHQIWGDFDFMIEHLIPMETTGTPRADFKDGFRELFERSCAAAIDSAESILREDSYWNDTKLLKRIIADASYRHPDPEIQLGPNARAIHYLFLMLKQPFEKFRKI